MINGPHLLILSFPTMCNYHISLYPGGPFELTDAALFHMAASGFFSHIKLVREDHRQEVVFSLNQEQLQALTVKGYNKALLKLLGESAK